VTVWVVFQNGCGECERSTVFAAFNDKQAAIKEQAAIVADRAKDAENLELCNRTSIEIEEVSLA